MPNFILGLIVGLTLAGSIGNAAGKDSFGRSPDDNRLIIAEADVLFGEQITKKYKEDGTVECRKVGPSSKAYTICSETGVVNGWHYEIYGDKSGHLGKTPEKDYHDPLRRGVWSIACSTDKMTDVRSCFGLRERLYISLSDNGMIAISVQGLEQRKLSPVMLRIDKKKPLETNDFWIGTDAAAILSELVKAEKVTMRYTNIYGNTVDNEMVPDGITELLDIFKFCLGLPTQELPKIKA